MAYRLLALDIDGTLLTSRKELTPRTRQAVLTLKEQGWLVTLVSGRRHLFMLDIASSLELTSPVVAFNGGMVFCPVSQQVLDCISIPLADLKDLAATLVASQVPVGIYTSSFNPPDIFILGGELLLEHSPYLLPLVQERQGMFISSLAELPGEAMRLMVGGSEGVTTKALEIAQPWLHQEKLWYMHSRDYDGTWYLEIFPQGSGKAKGLGKVCDYLKVTLQEVIAIGDQVNDVEMLQVAGLGVATGNAVAAAREAAQLVIGHHDHEGVAIYLESLTSSPLQLP